MRNPDRIDVFLAKVDWEELRNRWKIESTYMDDIVHGHYNKIIDYWKETPDQRIGQVLINLNLIPDIMQIWNDEESDILIAQGVPPEEILSWTSMYDELDQPLSEPITRFIKDLDSQHIVNIVKFCFKHGKILSQEYINAFSNVLCSRGIYYSIFDEVVKWWKDKEIITKHLESWDVNEKTTSTTEKQE